MDQFVGIGLIAVAALAICGRLRAGEEPVRAVVFAGIWVWPTFGVGMGLLCGSVVGALCFSAMLYGAQTAMVLASNVHQGIKPQCFHILGLLVNGVIGWTGAASLLFLVPGVPVLKALSLIILIPFGLVVNLGMFAIITVAPIKFVSNLIYGSVLERKRMEAAQAMRDLEEAM